jgi:hypothetical protein
MHIYIRLTRTVDILYVKYGLEWHMEMEYIWDDIKEKEDAN